MPELAAISRDWLAEWSAAHNAHDVDALTKLVHADVVWLDPAMLGEELVGRSAFREMLELSFRAFPDLHVEQGEPFLSADSPTIAVPWRLRGTFSGELRRLGKPAAPALKPTGRRFDASGIDLYTFDDDLLASCEIVWDVLSFMRQLGLLPDPDGRIARIGIHAQRATAGLARRLARQ